MILKGMVDPQAVIPLRSIRPPLERTYVICFWGKALSHNIVRVAEGFELRVKPVPMAPFRSNQSLDQVRK